MLKKVIAVLLAPCMSMTLCVSALAAEATTDPYSIEAAYVEELVELTDEEIAALSESEARELFEKAFPVSSEEFSESEVRTVLDGWAFALKFQTFMNLAAQTDATRATNASSTTANKTYYGSIGLAWTRDTTSSGSPLTLGELLSGVYTLEVDYISWDTASTILAASSDYDVFEDLKEQVAIGASGTTLGAIISAALGLTGTPAVVTSAAVGIAVSFGWNWLTSIDRANMYNCFEDMGRNDYMKVQFMYASNMVNRIYTEYTPSSHTFENPFPGTYGEWHTGTYGYLYSL